MIDLAIKTLEDANASEDAKALARELIRMAVNGHVVVTGPQRNNPLFPHDLVPGAPWIRPTIA